MDKTDDQKFSDFINNMIHQFGIYFTLIFTIIGILLNVLSIVILRRKVLRNTTMGFYNLVLAIINCFLMVNFILSLPNQFVTTSLLWNQIYCSFISFFSRVFCDLSSWVNVMFSFDRMITISFPRKFKIFRNKIFLISTILILTLIMGCVNFQSFEYFVNISYDYNNQSNFSTSNGSVVYVCTSNLVVIVSLNVIDALVRVTIPFILTIILDGILIYHLTSVKRERWMKRDEKFARSVIALNVLFLVTNMPYMISLVYLNILIFIQKVALTSRSYLITLLIMNFSAGNFFQNLNNHFKNINFLFF